MTEDLDEAAMGRRRFRHFSVWFSISFRKFPEYRRCASAYISEWLLSRKSKPSQRSSLARHRVRVICFTR